MKLNNVGDFKRKLPLSSILPPIFSTSYSHFPLFQLFTSNGRWLEKVHGYISKPDVCSCFVNPIPPNSFWTIWESAGGQTVKSESPPPLSCHKSCLAAQNKLLLETSLLALYPLPFITSEELQKAKKKKKINTSYPRNLWTDNTNISKIAFLS